MAEATTLGTSLLVPCVQELAKARPAAIPSRYIRDDCHTQPLSSSTSELPQVPVIDLQCLLAGESMDFELQKLHNASKDWGFFQLINHGVDSKLVEKVKIEIREFFNLPMEEKKKFWQKPGEMEGFGQLFVVSKEQKHDWCDVFSMMTFPIHQRKPHLFPKLPLPLRETLETYVTEMKYLAIKILDLMRKALKIDASDMRKLFEDGFQRLRVNYYPPCPQPELAIGINSHTDATGLTILLQVNEIDGLQIKKDGVWFPLTPLPDAFIINVGDILEIVTNGNYHSAEHRATVNSSKERLSVATFYSPNLDGDLGPAPSLVTPQTPALFKRVTAVDFFRGFFQRELVGKSYLDTMRITENEEGQNIV